MANYIQKLGTVVLLLVPTANSYATSTPFYQRPLNRKIEAPEYNLPLDIDALPEIIQAAELQKDIEALKLQEPTKKIR
jgi:hypothetical protein